MLAFIREPEPPARMRKPVDPKPANSSEEEDWSDDDEEDDDAVLAAKDGLAIAALLCAAGRNAAENGRSRRRLSKSMFVIALIEQFRGGVYYSADELQ